MGEVNVQPGKELTLETLRKAIKRMPGKAVLVPSQIWSLLVKIDGQVTGYICHDGFHKFDTEDQSCRKDTSVQGTTVHTTQDSPTAQSHAATVDGWPGPQSQSVPSAESPGCPGNS